MIFIAIFFLSLISARSNQLYKYGQLSYDSGSQKIWFGESKYECIN